MFEYLGDRVSSFSRSLSSAVRASFLALVRSPSLPAPRAQPPPRSSSRPSVPHAAEPVQPPPFDLRPLPPQTHLKPRYSSQSNANQEQEVDTLPMYFTWALRLKDQILSNKEQIQRNRSKVQSLLRRCPAPALYQEQAQDSEQLQHIQSRARKYQQEYARTIVRHREMKYKYELKSYPQITRQQYMRVRQAWQRRDEALAADHSFMPERMTYRNLNTLNAGTWLNDQIVNGLIRLMNRQLEGRGARVRIANSHFIGVVKGAGWQQKLDRVLKKMGFEAGMTLVVPVNRNNVHWYFCVLGDSIYLYDSFEPGDPPQILKQFQKRVRSADTQVVNCSFPRQLNSYDCGVFMLTGIRDYLRQDHSVWSFQQTDMPFKRIQIAAQLLEGRLLDRFT